MDPRLRDEVFEFFTKARNLQAVTPPWLSFSVRTPDPIVMRKGTPLDYRIRIHRLPIHWRTEISEWEPPFRFVDEQLRGPYTPWHHTHTFEERNGGTLCTDEVRYCPRGGWRTHWMFVRREVESIFAYRRERLLELFPAHST